MSEDRLLDLLDVPGFGRFAAQDMLFGYRPELAAGNLHMAHKSGFTRTVLTQTLLEAGFGAVAAYERPACYDLWAVATAGPCTRESLAALVRAHCPG